MTPRAYSYVRFSTAEQLKGKSLERQTEAAAVYAAQNGLTLDTSLSLKDLGVSAFRGKNASVGALSVFLARVADGTVPRGSFLLIETFDRMSRESAYDAQLTLQNIINSGVTVVTLLDGKRYSVEILRADPMALIYTILLMSRSHEESSTKSKRIGDGWTRKRKSVHPGKVYTKNTPGWIRVSQSGKLEIVAAHAEVVRRIFDMYLEGAGAMKIAVALNNDKVPCWTGSPYWRTNYVARCASNRAVLGELQPGTSDMHGRQRIRKAFGEPIKNYFPPIIAQSMFDQVQAVIRSNRDRRGPISAKSARSLLARLAACPVCGGRMEYTYKYKGVTGRYVCSRARVGKSCTYRSVMTETVDQALIAAADKLYAEMPSSDPAARVRLAQVELALVETDKKLYDLGVLLDDNTPPKMLVARMRDLETLKEDLARDVEELKSQLTLSDPQYVRDRAKRLRDALSWHSADPSDVGSVNQALHECFSKVVVNYQNNTLECVWKHGPTSIIPYAL